MVRKYKVRLILFDVDGTLIDSGGAGRRSLNSSFFELTGIKEGIKGIIPDGMTDPMIILEMFRKRLGRDPTATEFKKMKSLYLHTLREEVYLSKDYKVLSGVYKLLKKLSRDKRFLLGLGTGNFEEGAKIKLGRANLNRFFPFGGFGSDSIDRVEIIKIGSKRGKKLSLSEDMEVEAVFIVGDTPYDIRAGKQAGVETIAVASGNFTKEELEEECPTVALPSLENAEDSLRLIIGL